MWLIIIKYTVKYGRLSKNSSMTLYIKINDYEEVAQRGFLVVEGSKAGLLISKQISSGKSHNTQAFRIICASDDHLHFIFCKSVDSYKNGEYLGTADLHVPVLVKRYDAKLNLDDDFILKIELFSPKNNVVAVITCDMTYDKVSHFEGEYSMAGKKTQTVVVKSKVKGRKVQLYKGKCETKNLFSMLDTAAEGQRTKFIESIYKDED